jgi:hypothetical protein
MDNFELFSFNSFLNAAYSPIFEASNLSKTGMPKKLISAIHQKLEHRSEVYPELGYVNMGGKAVTLEYKYFRPTHDIEVPEPLVFTGRKVPPPAGVARTAHYTDFAQYLQDLPNGPLNLLLAIPDKEVFVFLYFKKKWGGGPNEGGQQYAIIAWDKDENNAVDFGFLGLTTEGVEKNLVRIPHKLKGGNTNAKVQEYINSLGGGAPSRETPLYAYEFEVKEEARKSRETREKGATVLSLDLLRVFANKYSKIISAMPDDKKAELASKINGEYISARSVPAEIITFAQQLGESPERTYGFLIKSMVDFRKKMFEEGGGSYQRESGYSLEEENIILSDILDTYGRGKYDISRQIEQPSKRFPMGDTRIDPNKRRARSLTPDKKARRVPMAGDYASIESMIKAHTLDGVLHRFMWFITSGKITAPSRNVLALLGIDPNSDILQGLPDFESWRL